MPISTAWLIAIVGLAVSAGVYWLVHWDARNNDIDRPRLWAAVASGTCVVGVLLYAFVPTVPLTGVLLTANTGPVLYGFEREVVNEGEDPADPGWIPAEESAGGGTAVTDRPASDQSSEE